MQKTMLLLLLMASAEASTPVRVDALAWLSGCWSADGAEAGSGEQWSLPAGGTMLGTSRTIRDGRSVAFEFMRIAESDPHGLVFVASPSGQATTEFTLKRLAVDEVVFENPEHDFPNRVLYRRVSPDRLFARIEGKSAGKDTAIDFPMTRTGCGGVRQP